MHACAWKIDDVLKVLMYGQDVCIIIRMSICVYQVWILQIWLVCTLELNPFKSYGMVVDKKVMLPYFSIVVLKFIQAMKILLSQLLINKLIFLYLKARRFKYYTLKNMIMYIKLHKLSWIRTNKIHKNLIPMKWTNIRTLQYKLLLNNTYLCTHQLEYITKGHIGTHTILF